MTDPADYAPAVEKSRRGFGDRLRGLLRGGAISDETWEEVEETLIAADLGAELALRVVDKARKRKDVANAEAAVYSELLNLYAPRDAAPWPRVPAPGVPAVILVVGVNGTGKTTSIAKLARRFSSRGARVLLGRRRHVPCRRHRAVGDVGQPHRRARRCAPGRGGSIGRRL